MYLAEFCYLFYWSCATVHMLIFEANMYVHSKYTFIYFTGFHKS